MPELTPIAPPETRCKVCAAPSPLHGVNDFNKSCAEPQGVVLPLSGVPVFYYRCSRCGLLFTRAFDDWTSEDFSAHVYNEGYRRVDPDFETTRPHANAVAVHRRLGRAVTSVFDYGGGSGEFARKLTSLGLPTTSWDPYHQPGDPPSARAELVTCFEVLEHTVDPLKTFEQYASFRLPEGVLWFSTLAIDTAPRQAIQHWYVSPRNGHVTIYTKAALRILCDRFGLTVGHANDNLHIAYSVKPAWLNIRQ